MFHLLRCVYLFLFLFLILSVVEIKDGAVSVASALLVTMKVILLQFRFLVGDLTLLVIHEWLSLMHLLLMPHIFWYFSWSVLYLFQISESYACIMISSKERNLESLFIWANIRLENKLYIIYLIFQSLFMQINMWFF